MNDSKLHQYVCDEIQKLFPFLNYLNSTSERKMSRVKLSLQWMSLLILSKCLGSARKMCFCRVQQVSVTVQIPDNLMQVFFIDLDMCSVLVVLHMCVFI